ncbi:hypothetical protein [Variovorax sp. E3]|uniref:hypothetical protein n=1 Tax=Variovorax sp. E3 TaxID=1914993 RepID=UPI0018DBEB3F|nr:hypothetical protein [Variovorax sp. E3]
MFKLEFFVQLARLATRGQVQPMRRLQKQRDGSLLDEMPKIIRVKMHFGGARHGCQGFGHGRFPGTRQCP